MSIEAMKTVLPPEQAAISIPDAVAGWTGFLKWVMAYSHEITEVIKLREPVTEGSTTAMLAVSNGLSASFNFGFEADTQTIFLALEPEEYEWLPLMPIKEVVIGREAIYILTHEVDLGEHELLQPIALEVFTSQPQLWRVFADVKDIGFMCVRFQQKGYFVEEYADRRFPVRIVS